TLSLGTRAVCAAGLKILNMSASDGFICYHINMTFYVHLMIERISNVVFLCSITSAIVIKYAWCRCDEWRNCYTFMKPRRILSDSLTL
ncbi:TPA: hypothetical protein ACQVK9_004779, partial [Serratia marcescens]